MPQLQYVNYAGVISARFDEHFPRCQEKDELQEQEASSFECLSTEGQTFDVVSKSHVTTVFIQETIGAQQRSDFNILTKLLFFEHFLKFYCYLI